MQGPPGTHVQPYSYSQQLFSFSFLWLMQLKGRAALYWHHNAVMSSDKHPQIWWGMVKFSQNIPHFGIRGSCLYEGVLKCSPATSWQPAGSARECCPRMPLWMCWRIWAKAQANLGCPHAFVSKTVYCLSICQRSPHCWSFWVWWWFTSWNSTFFIPS